jgi:ribosomal subunit interface protein
MRLLLTSKNLSNPSISTLNDYSQDKITHLNEFLQKAKLNGENNEARVNAEFIQRKKIFKLKAIFKINGTVFVVELHNTNIRRAIDEIVSNLRKQIVEFRGKKWLNRH